MILGSAFDSCIIRSCGCVMSKAVYHFLPQYTKPDHGTWAESICCPRSQSIHQINIQAFHVIYVENCVIITRLYITQYLFSQVFNEQYLHQTVLNNHLWLFTSTFINYANYVVLYALPRLFRCLSSIQQDLVVIVYNT